jgi:alpha-glucosidase
MEEYPAITSVGEVGDAQRGMEIQAQYTSGNDKVHMAYAFDFLSATPLTAQYVAHVLQRFEDGIGDGWGCWSFSNHDVVRHASRWNLGEDARRLYAALLMSLRGTICLYQGEELGLTEAYVAYEELQDPYGIRFWPKFKGRDGCRTPMPWISDNQNGGFSDSQPWLPVAVEHLQRSVSDQMSKDDSTLQFYRRMIAFRHAYDALIKGSITDIAASDGIVSFIRSHGEQRVFCAFNMTNMAHAAAIPEGRWRQDKGTPFTAIENDTGLQVTLPPYQAYFAVQEDAA